MPGVLACQPSHRFVDPLHRFAVSPPAAAPPVNFPATRNMSNRSGSHYTGPWLSGPQLGTRSSSVSSTSSSTSFPSPYNTANPVGANHGCVSRGLSPASSIHDFGPETAMFPRHQYQGLAQDPSHLSQTQLTQTMPNPALYLHAQYAPSPPLHPSNPTPRQMPRPPPYGYSHNAMSQQPPQLSFQTYNSAMYPSYSTTPYHSSATLPSYQMPPLVHRPAEVPQLQVTQEEVPDGNLLFKGLQKLPPGVIAEIRKLVGWRSCWKVSQASAWFRQNFHPDQLPEEMRHNGVFQAEANYGRDEDESNRPDSHPSPRKSNNKSPPWFGCYHCYRLKLFHNFELFQWNISPKDTDESDDESKIAGSTSITRSGQVGSPPPRSSPPTSNPHYDPSLTGSSLRAAAASNRRASAFTGDNSSSSTNPAAPRDIVRATWGTRRFCVECGLRHRYYQPRDLIYVHNPPKKDYALWVCACWKLHDRPRVVECQMCGEHTPLRRSCMTVH